MNTSTESTVKGKYNEVAGRVKQATGEAFNDQEMANAGAAQQVKGHAQQAWGSVQQSAQDMKEREQPRAQQTAHDIREKVVSTAQNVKERIQDSFESHRHPK